jgi:hypothetical protein
MTNTIPGLPKSLTWIPATQTKPAYLVWHKGTRTFAALYEGRTPASQIMSDLRNGFVRFHPFDTGTRQLTSDRLFRGRKFPTRDLRNLSILPDPSTISCHETIQATIIHALAVARVHWQSRALDAKVTGSHGRILTGPDAIAYGGNEAAKSTFKLILGRLDALTTFRSFWTPETRQLRKQLADALRIARGCPF